MKKLTAMLLGLALLCCAVFAVAEDAAELPYLETESQDVYLSATVLTEASYPMVCISPYGTYDLFSRDKYDPWYVTFPCPEGMRCTSFGADNADFLNLDANDACDYYYQATDRYSYESFLLDCENKDNILLDGSDKVAAYILPDSGRARALFGLDEIQEGAKMYVQIFVNGLNRKEDDEKTEILKTKITDEIARLQESMSFVKMDKFWTDGAYKGVKLYSKSFAGNYLTIDMPEMEFTFEEAGIGGNLFPVDVDGTSVKCYAGRERRKYIEVDFSADTYSYVYYSREESEITKVTLSDGNEWGIYVANENDGKPYSVHAARVVNTIDSNGEEKPVYLTVQISCSSVGTYWPDLDAFVKDLDVIAQCIHTAE